jgi:RNA polymerase sigma factor (sigma-70 family)
MNTLEVLAKAYDDEPLPRKKDRILLQIFNAYQPLILKLCKQYSGIDEPEVIAQHIHLAIALALNNRKKFYNVKAAIFSHVRREMVENIIRPHYRLKTSVGKDIALSDCVFKLESYLQDIKDESGDAIEKSIMQIDLDTAMQKLPSKEYEILKLWLQGYSLKEIKAFMDITSVLYARSIYYHFKQARKRLIKLLPEYCCG